MKTLRQLHLYLGCFFAPLVLVFAFTGVIQTFELHEAKKDGSYVPPHWVDTLATLHKHDVLTKGDSPTAMRVLVTCMSLALVLTMVLGVVLAFKFGRSAILVLGALALGVLVPLAVLVLR
jgi:uncharacterized iron-regulated membrane protein